MQWEQFPLGPLQTNAYILYNEKNEAIIFDPGGEGMKLNTIIEAKALKPHAILLTHGHFDHIGGVDEVRDLWKVPVYIHKNEQDWLTDASKNGSNLFMPGSGIKAKAPADYLINEEGKLEIGSFECQVFETPGHSPGSVSYYFKEANIIFSGDVLFYGGIGRTDLPGGDSKTLLASIHEKLLGLPEETIVASGHGPTTTIANEIQSNPFLNGF
ncbi:MAG: MBL fold metallo-hydrolase [Bacillaceae bacterium]|nr:MBL fold metallo-hydrolase [Bacillaceae bacterium]